MALEDLGDLAAVERYLKDLSKDVASQTRLVRWLTRDGRDATIEAQVLTNMRGALDALEWRAAQLRREKARASAVDK